MSHPHKKAECVCGGRGMCVACMVPTATQPVGLEDAYAYAMGGEPERGAVVALIIIASKLGQIDKTLQRIADSPGQAVRLNLTATLIDKEGIPVSTSIKVNPTLNDLLFEVDPRKPDGSPATLAGPLNWTSSTTGVALEVATDGLSAKGRVSSDGISAVHVGDGVSSDEIQVIADSTPAPPEPVTLNLSATLIPKGA